MLNLAEMWMSFNRVWMRSSRLWMRSSRVVRASDSQCRSRNYPGFDTSILQTLWNLMGGRWSSAEYRTQKKKKIQKNPPFKIWHLHLREGKWDTLKIKCVDSRVNVHILDSTSVLYLHTDTVQGPNLALIHMKRMTVHWRAGKSVFGSGG